MLFQRLKLKIMSMLLLGTMAICAAIFAAYVGYGLICEARSPVVGGILILGVFLPFLGAGCAMMSIGMVDFLRSKASDRMAGNWSSYRRI
ncbi:hypothetical protein ACFQAT_28625 [Undibacterium arcticum]|uniref:Uncharacterized protein n=1 Tax=Undibacterium arcticum TaxID=1762892 RepID=A0ABV7FB09_9BURK